MNKKTTVSNPLHADFSDYLRAQNDGGIWWRLIDAVKLGAGYVPVRDDDQNLVATLRATNHMAQANERTLLAEFGPTRCTQDHPKLLVRAHDRFVEAQEFLDWLAQYMAASGDSTIVFPAELARAVKAAKLAPVVQSAETPAWVSLTRSLEGRFDRPFVKLPEAVRARVEREFFPYQWDELAESQRRSVARQNDARNDPALEPERKFWWDFHVRKDALEREIASLADAPSPTALDQAEKRDRLTALRQELAVMNRQERSDEARRKRTQDEAFVASTPSEAVRYTPYPKAMKYLADRYGATPDEMAAWVFMGPTVNGLSAYLNANELNPPPRFSFQDRDPSTNNDFDYIAPLMACWFDEAELAAFTARDRYVTGATLCERWRDKCDGRPEAFIIARIRESNLLDIHPITIATQASHPSDDTYPPLQAGLYSVEHVEAVEAEFFAAEDTKLLAAGDGRTSSLEPVSAMCIKLNFRVYANDDDANDKWWDTRMADAKRNGLDACRVGAARRGKIGGSLWRPDLVAGWLLGKKDGARGTISPVGIRNGLKRFPGYEQIADDMQLPD